MRSEGWRGGASRATEKRLTRAARSDTLSLLARFGGQKVSSRCALRSAGSGANTKHWLGIDLCTFEEVLLPSWSWPRGMLDSLLPVDALQGAQKKVGMRVDRGRNEVLHYAFGTG